jgi:hypothetical protein
MNRFGVMFSKMKQRRSRRDAPLGSMHLETFTNISIDSVPFSDNKNLTKDDPNCYDKFGEKVQATTIQVSTTESPLPIEGNKPIITLHKPRRKQRIAFRQEYYVTLGEAIKSFRCTRQHLLYDEINPYVAYYMDATLYPIPEHGAGLCYMKYTTVYEHGESDVWSIDESNDRPHHRRSTLVYEDVRMDNKKRHPYVPSSFTK